MNCKLFFVVFFSIFLTPMQIVYSIIKMICHKPVVTFGPFNHNYFTIIKCPSEFKSHFTTMMMRLK